MIISEGEVGIDVPVGDHGEVEMVSFRRLVRINGADELDELSDTETHDRREMSPRPPSPQPPTVTYEAGRRTLLTYGCMGAVKNDPADV